jgi:ArsR family transcriptional regulator
MASAYEARAIFVNANMKDRLATLERTFQALGDQTRLRILALLATGEVCVCYIHESLDLPQPKVSRHLAYLRRAGLVDARKDGLWVHYRLADVSDPVSRTVRDAVTHALWHVDVVKRDAKSLAKRQTCSLPSPAAASPTCACCAPDRI